MPRFPLDALRTLAVLAVILVMPLLAAPQVRDGFLGLLRAPAAPSVDYINPNRWIAAEHSQSITAVDFASSEISRPGGGHELATASSAAWPVRLPATSESQHAPTAPPSGGPPGWPLYNNPRIQKVHQRLRRLGAEQMQLEAANAQENLFIFRCQFAAVREGAYSRLFEATDADPLRAMQRVLAQVEDWRLAARPVAPLSPDGQRAFR